MKRIHVNQQVIRHNEKYGNSLPTVRVEEDGKETRYCEEVLIDGPSRVVYRPKKPLACGAKLWIETNAPLALIGVASYAVIKTMATNRRELILGSNYEGSKKTDQKRLMTQTERVFDAIRDGKWRTLDRISKLVSAPPASVSAQLRHLRKRRFGGHVIEKEHLGDGLYQYRLLSRFNTLQQAASRRKKGL